MNEIKEEFVSVDWSPDAARLISGSTSSAAIWDPATGHVAIKLPMGGATSVRWNPDGRRVAVGWAFEGLYIWDASHGYEQNQ